MGTLSHWDSIAFLIQSLDLSVPVNASLISLVSCLFGLKRRDQPKLFLRLKECHDNDTVIHTSSQRGREFFNR